MKVNPKSSKTLQSFNIPLYIFVGKLEEIWVMLAWASFPQAWSKDTWVLLLTLINGFVTVAYVACLERTWGLEGWAPWKGGPFQI